MKTVLVVSPNPVNRILIEKHLAKHFALEFEQGRDVDAIICEVPDGADSSDLIWVEALDLPTVVLAPRGTAPIAAASNRSIVEYPLNMDRILEALARLGVTGANRNRAP